MTLRDIISSGESNANKTRNSISFESVDKYIIELIRISELYKFELKVRPKRHFKKSESEALRADAASSMQNANGESGKAENVEEARDDSWEIKGYISAENEDGMEVKISYNNGAPKKESEDYKAEKTEKIRHQELWEKTGFYQERTYLYKVKVQLWPEHLPYDHFKRKRAFLFC